MPTLIIPIYPNDTDLDFLVLELDTESLRLLNQLKEIQIELAPKLDDLFDPGASTGMGKFSEISISASFLDPHWYGFPKSEEAQEALSEVLDGSSILTLAEPPPNLGEPSRVESETLHLDHQGFWFTARPKHWDQRVQSYDVSWRSLPADSTQGDQP